MEKQEYKPESGKFKPGSEPDGFRGIKWWTNIKELSGMRYIKSAPIYGIVEGYIRENDELKMGDALLKRILYWFWMGENFYSVEIYTEGYINFDRLKEVVFEKFGEGSQPNKDVEEYFWSGEITTMCLAYNKSKDEGCLRITSNIMSLLWKSLVNKKQVIKEYYKKKAKEGAEKGF